MGEQQWPLRWVWPADHTLLTPALRINLGGGSQQVFSILENPINFFQNTQEDYLFQPFFSLGWCHITGFQ